jgi:hypothetical protein
LFILEMVTSTRRWRVEGLAVALTQRTHSQRAIGVMSFQMSLTSCGAPAKAAARSGGMSGSGQSRVACTVTRVPRQLSMC